MQDNLPLSGLTVVAVEQAVAAPFASSRLADAGARVIKVERPEGDFARGYDRAAAGQSSYFVWLNRGKESVAMDLSTPAGRSALERLLAGADVLIQNLRRGALAKLGFGFERLARDYPRLVVCSISGYGEDGPMADRKAYDLLIQAEFRPLFDHRRPERAGAGRLVDRRHRHRRHGLRRHPRSANPPRRHRQGRRDFRVDVRRNGGLVDRAAHQLRRPASRRVASAWRIPRFRPMACFRPATASRC